MQSDVIQLIKQTQQKDAYGRQVAVETKRQVFCQVDSVTRSEWFEGGRNGLNPEYRFTVFAPDYEKEDTAEYNGERYAIYRTHQEGDYMELYVEHQEGA